MHRLDPGTRREKGEQEKGKGKKKKKERVLLTIDVMTAPLYLISPRMDVCTCGCTGVGCRM